MMEWQPMNTLPHNAERILVVDEDFIEIASWSDLFGLTNEFGNKIFATHWMPLPEPPTQSSPQVPQQSERNTPTEESADPDDRKP